MSCAGLIDEARVTVDVALLERAAFPSPLLVVALLLALAGLALAVRAAPTGHRAWSFFTLLAPIGALLGWLAMQAPTGLSFPCLVEPAHTAARLVAIAAGIGALCFLQLGVTLTLRAWKQDLHVLWPVVLLGAALALSGGVGWHKRSLLREFSQRVKAALPLPNVRPPLSPPEAHVDRALAFKPDVEAAGQTTGLLFRSRVAFAAADRARWVVDTVLLKPTGVGLTRVPLRLVQDLVSVEAELSVRGVRDVGPAWFPLAKGHRWEFVAVRGRGGALARLRVALERGKKPLPDTAVTLEVTAEGERDGFHFFELTETRLGTEPRVREVVRREGELFSRGARIAFVDGEHCHVGLLEPAWCTCVEDRVSHCTVVHGDLGETLLRLFLGAVTLGITELQGMGDLGAGNEAGLLLTRWVLNGERGSLAPRAKSK